MITEELIMKFLQNSWIVFITTTFTIIGIPLSIYLYFKSKKEKSLKFEIKSNNIFKNFESIIENVKVTCKNKNISTLTITKILMWCNGKETIYDTDIATQMPLIIKTREDKDILEAKVISSNNLANNVHLEKLENNLYKINFEFLDNKDGFIIQVVHTGNNSNDIIVDGKIKGIKKNIGNKFPQKKGILEKISEYEIFENFILFILGGIAILIILSFIGYIFLYLYALFFREESLKIASHILFIICLYFCYLLAKKIKSLFKIPKEFQDF